MKNIKKYEDLLESANSENGAAVCAYLSKVAGIKIPVDSYQMKGGFYKHPTKSNIPGFDAYYALRKVSGTIWKLSINFVPNDSFPSDEGISTAPFGGGRRQLNAQFGSEVIILYVDKEKI